MLMYHFERNDLPAYNLMYSFFKLGGNIDIYRSIWKLNVAALIFSYRSIKTNAKKKGCSTSTHKL